MSGDKVDILLLIAAAGAAVIAGLFSAAALALDEDEANSRSDQIVSVATQIVTSALIDGGVHLHGILEQDQCPRRYICWDRNRAKFCIAKDYLGPNPSFGPDELKRIFRVSRQNYDGLRNYLCHVQTFFHDGVDATRWTKISSDANIMIALKYLAYGIC